MYENIGETEMENILIIKDNTPGFLFLGFLIIMLLIIRIVYLTGLMWMEKSRHEKLKKLQYEYENHIHTKTGTFTGHNEEYMSRITNKNLNSNSVRDDLYKMELMKKKEKEEAEKILEILYR